LVTDRWYAVVEGAELLALKHNFANGVRIPLHIYTLQNNGRDRRLPIQRLRPGFKVDR